MSPRHLLPRCAFDSLPTDNHPHRDGDDNDDRTQEPNRIESIPLAQRRSRRRNHTATSATNTTTHRIRLDVRMASLPFADHIITYTVLEECTRPLVMPLVPPLSLARVLRSGSSLMMASHHGDRANSSTTVDDRTLDHLAPPTLPTTSTPPPSSTQPTSKPMSRPRRHRTVSCSKNSDSMEIRLQNMAALRLNLPLSMPILLSFMQVDPALVRALWTSSSS